MLFLCFFMLFYAFTKHFDQFTEKLGSLLEEMIISLSKWVWGCGWPGRLLKEIIISLSKWVWGCSWPGRLLKEIVISLSKWVWGCSWPGRWLGPRISMCWPPSWDLMKSDPRKWSETISGPTCRQAGFDTRKVSGSGCPVPPSPSPESKLPGPAQKW